MLKRRIGDKTQTLELCEPCGRVVRGKQKLERVTDLRDFACCMGQGNFLHIAGKVDQSFYEIFFSLKDTLKSNLI